MFGCESTASLQAWLGALAPLLGQLQELGLEDCSLSPARYACRLMLAP